MNPALHISSSLWKHCRFLLAALICIGQCAMVASCVTGSPASSTSNTVLAGPVTIERAMALNKEVLVLHGQQRFEEALAKALEALPLWEELRPPVHEDVAQALINVGMLYKDLEQYEECIQPLERALEIRRKLRGPLDPEVVLHEETLIYPYLMIGDVEHGLEYFRAAFNGWYRTLEPNSGNAADKFIGLGDFAIGMYMDHVDDHAILEEAVVPLQMGLDIRNDLLGPGNDKTIRALHALGYVLYVTGEFQAAADLFNQYLPPMADALGSDHGQVGATLNKLALCYLDLRDPERCLDATQRSLPIMESFYGPDHEKVIRSLNLMAEAYMALGEHERALPLLERALSICRRLHADDYWEMQMLRELVAQCESAINSPALAGQSVTGSGSGSPASGGETGGASVRSRSGAALLMDLGKDKEE